MGIPKVHLVSLLLFMPFLFSGCNAYQPTKNVWKTTKDLWYTYMSPPSSVNYEDKGTLSARTLALTNSMMGIDVELARLERVMLNADRPPTREWLTSFLTSFPWINGFAGVKYDGTILGQEPATFTKQLDYIPLLYEDKKQNSRALRADVQNTPLGPEILIAAPLYDGTDFLGIVAANFDIRSLMQYSPTPQDVVILSPQGLLWPGKYDYAATPLANVPWEETVKKSAAGTCSNSTGTFYYNIRYLGNLPLVFAVVESGSFPEGNGDVSQGLAFFPQERPQLPPPPHEERKSRPNFAQGLTVETPSANTASAEQHDTPSEAPSVSATRGQTDIQPGSRDSVLLRRKQAERRSRVHERQLEGENIAIDRRSKVKASRQTKPLPPPTGLGLSKDLDTPTLPGGRPSPFGPHEDGPAHQNDQSHDTQHEDSASTTQNEDIANRSAETSPTVPLSSKQDQEASKRNIENPAAPENKTDVQSNTAAPSVQEKTTASPESLRPAMLPGGRPSPFGPQGHDQ